MRINSLKALHLIPSLSKDEATFSSFFSGTLEMRRRRDFWTIHFGPFAVKATLTMYAKPLIVV